jgi:HlyD family secretion protein
MKTKSLIWIAASAVPIAVAAYFAWHNFAASGLPDGFALANGRIEAEQIDIATKLGGRIAQVLADEGQMVDAGAVVARMDAGELEAQLRAAQAQVRRAEQEELQAVALISQRGSERDHAGEQYQRAMSLHDKGFFPTEKLDERRTQLNTAQAAYDTAVAGLGEAKAAIDVAAAEVERLKTLIADTLLVAPRRGRIEYKLAEPGEVLAPGGRVLTLLDLTDVYMTIFLPAGQAGHLAFNSQARIVLDPVPQYVIPARVTFVAAEAQFTPKTVETAEEREKLMFRVKLTIAPDLLKQYESQVKAGVRGIAYVRIAAGAGWPDSLAVKLPQ